MSKFNILLIAGHGAGDPGATTDAYVEATLNRECTERTAKELEKFCNVYIYPFDRNAYKDAEKGYFRAILNQYFPGVKFHYAFERHFNKFNISAYGTECFVVPEEAGISVEQNVMKRMSKYYKLRDNDNIFDGVKRTRFLVINTLKQMGVSGALLETCFIDNPSDMKIWEENKEAIDKDIALGIVEGFGLSATNTEAVVQKPTTAVKVPSQADSSFNEGDTVTLLKKATIYLGADFGVTIGSEWKGKNYTVAKVSSDGEALLLKEITSWVYASECKAVTSKAVATPKPTEKKLEKGMKAKPKTDRDYYGTDLINSVTKNYYTVIDIDGDRVVLGDGLNTAFNINNLIY